jgi:hypothetical protein
MTTSGNSKVASVPVTDLSIPRGEPDIIVVDGQAPDACPYPALEPVWTRVTAVLKHYAWFNADDARVRRMQHEIMLHGVLIVPSIFGQGKDLCTRAFYFSSYIFYHFVDGPEEYFWITSLLNRCYALGALYFPAKSVAVSLYPYTIEASLLRGFEDMRVALRCPAALAPAPPLVVVGCNHMFHTLWNELSALDYATAAGLSPHLRIATTYQPMGPLERLFPELRGRVEPYTFSDLHALNETVRMFTALGSLSIPKSTRPRVVRTARELAPSATLAEQEQFRRRHHPILWLSAKPPDRTCVNQVETLAAIIRGFHAVYPTAGFLLDGVSYPWDYDSNENYFGGFHSYLEIASAKTSEIINAVIDSGCRPSCGWNLAWRDLR